MAGTGKSLPGGMGGGGAAPPGTRYDPVYGGYVANTQEPVSNATVDPKTGKPYTKGDYGSNAAGQASTTGAATNAMWQVDPSGNASYASNAPGTSMADQSSLMNQQAAIQAAAEQRRLASIQGLFSSGQASSPAVSGSGPNDASAAQAAAFSKAKSQTGETLRAALDSLRSAYAGTGNVGGYEQGVARMMAGGVNQIGDVTNDQLMAEFNRAGQVADRNYQGAITQRGQNMSQVPALMGLMTARTLY